MPIDRVLLGANSKQTTLTNSQIKFAEEMAMGKTKAEAYRKSRPNGRVSNAKPATASRRGNELARDSRIQAQIEAFQLAMEAQKYTTPLHLRALVIQKLTEKAIDPDVKDSQQLKALELIGKLTEVQSFTERREVVNINTDSGEMKAKLIQSLRLALSNQDVEDVDEADQLLAEITGETNIVIDDEDNNPVADDEVLIVSGDDDGFDEGDGLVQTATFAPHSTPTPNNCPSTGTASLHSIPHSGDLTITNVRVTNPSESNTYVSTSGNPNTGTPPLSVSNAKG
jgi:hypothetical protein